MHAASEIAEWWDDQQRQAKKELDHFIDDNPNLFGVIVATVAATAMDVGAGAVDTLRFGEGAAEGGVRGFGKDALRLIGLAGPLGRGAKLVQGMANARLARVIVDTGGPVCGWVSGTQALRQTGTKAFAAIDDLAKALGKTISELGGSRLADRIALFRQVGARISVLRQVKSFEEIAAMTPNNGSITMFNVFGKRLNKGVLEDVGHALYAFRDSLGRLRIMDRGGRAGKLGDVFASLEEVARKYGLQGQWQVREAALMENVFAKFMTSISSAPVFALDVYALAGVNQAEHETVAQAFEVHRTIQQQGKKFLQQKSPRRHTVVRGESLSRIAQKYYGNLHKWPVLYEANRDIIGPNPNLIKPGQEFLIPELPIIKATRNN